MEEKISSKRKNSPGVKNSPFAFGASSTELIDQPPSKKKKSGLEDKLQKASFPEHLIDMEENIIWKDKNLLGEEYSPNASSTGSIEIFEEIISKKKKSPVVQYLKNTALHDHSIDIEEKKSPGLKKSPKKEAASPERSIELVDQFLSKKKKSGEKDRSKKTFLDNSINMEERISSKGKNSPAVEDSPRKAASCAPSVKLIVNSKNKSVGAWKTPIGVLKSEKFLTSANIQRIKKVLHTIENGHFKQSEVDEIFKREINSLNRISSELCEKLSSLHIELDWHVPYLHNLYPWLYNTHLYDEHAPETSKPIKMGLFKAYEDEIIMQNWEQFCKLYNLNPRNDYKGFLPKLCKRLDFPVSRQEMIKFAQFLARGLPDRALYTVYARFVDMFKFYKKGQYSKEEIDILQQLHRSGLSSKMFYSVCSSILHRSRYSLYSKMTRLLQVKNFVSSVDENDNPRNFDVSSAEDYDNLTNSEESVVERTDGHIEYLSSYQDLKRAILYFSGSHNLKDWDKYTESVTSWNIIGKACSMSPVDAKLRYLCTVRVKEFYKSRKIPKFNSLKMKILKRLIKQKWRNWEDVQWGLLTKKLKYLGPVFPYLIFRKMVKNEVPYELWQSLEDCIEYLHCKHLLMKNNIEDNAV